MASSANDTTAMSISNATMASRSASVASRTANVVSPGLGHRGLLPSGIGRNTVPPHSGQPVGLQRGDARPPAARPDLVHGLAAARTGTAGTAARLSAVYRAPS